MKDPIHWLVSCALAALDAVADVGKFGQTVAEHIVAVPQVEFISLVAQHDKFTPPLLSVDKHKLLPQACIVALVSVPVMQDGKPVFGSQTGGAPLEQYSFEDK